MKRLINHLTLITIAVAALATAFAPADSELSDLLLKLEKLRGDYAQEKVYLQLDKPVYGLNEDIWLKGYVVNAEQNELTAISKIQKVNWPARFLAML